jgi:hypothetical protein
MIVVDLLYAYLLMSLSSPNPLPMKYRPYCIIHHNLSMQGPDGLWYTLGGGTIYKERNVDTKSRGGLAAIQRNKLRTRNISDVMNFV